MYYTCPFAVLLAPTIATAVGLILASMAACTEATYINNAGTGTGTNTNNSNHKGFSKPKSKLPHPSAASAHTHVPPGKSLETEWIQPAGTESMLLPGPVPLSMLPRSGHVAFTVGKDHYIFGGYAEEEVTATADADAGDNENSVTITRYPINDLWKRTSRVHVDAGAGTGTATGRGTGPIHEMCSSWEKVDQKGECPEERLVSAVSVLNGKPYLFGGWNPNNRQAGNEILDTVHALDIHTETETDIDIDTDSQSKSHEWRKLPITFPDGPTSRHVALTLPCQSRALIHNHRCTDFVYIFDAKTETFRKQRTVGVAPSSRGLHAACMLGSFALFFGGADKSGQMSNEVFLLNTFTWEWTKVKFDRDRDETDQGVGLDADADADADTDTGKDVKMPCVRAAPSIVSFNETCAILYGGAKASPNGLQPLDDVWALFVNRFSGDGRWELMSPITSSSESTSASSADGGDSFLDLDLPPGRNAATLTEIGSVPIDETAGSFNLVAAPMTKLYLLHGGWAPFRKTFMDDFVLRVSLDTKEGM